MKNSWLIIGLALTWLGLPSITRGQEPAPPAFEKGSKTPQSQSGETNHLVENANAPKLVRVQVEFVELSHEALTELLFLSKPTSSDATELRKQVQEMVAKNEAKVLETQMITARSGQKATTEAIHELIYPTEYEPPSLPCGGNDPSSITTMKSNLAPIPTAFETRNLGSTLEVEPTVGQDDKIIDLRFIPDIVYHTGNTTWYEGKDLGGNPFKVMMPDMYAVRINTSLTCMDGQYTLAGLVSPKDAKGDTDMTRKVAARNLLFTAPRRKRVLLGICFSPRRAGNGSGVGRRRGVRGSA